MKIGKLDLLISLYIICIAISELMGAKTFQLLNFGDFHLNASVAIFTVPIIFSINDIIAEVFGKERMKSIMYAGLVGVLLLFVFAGFATWLPPSTRSAPQEAAYDSIFHSSMRMSAASLLAFLGSMLLDIAIFWKIRERMKKHGLWLRNNVSNIIAQFADTAIFMILAFYNFSQPFASNMSFIISISLPYWLLKCFMSVIETPFVYVGVSWLGKGEGGKANKQISG